MGSVFTLLLKKYNSLLEDLTMGYVISKDELSELLRLLHILHYASNVEDFDKNLNTILDYYG